MALTFSLLVALVAFPARAFAEEFELRAGDPVEVDAGQSGSASLTISPAAGHSIHAGAGIRIRLLAPDGIELPKKRLGRADAADPRADAPRFDVPLVGRAAGSYTIVADVRFWICAARTCRPARGKAEISVTVRPAPQ